MRKSLLINKILHQSLGWSPEWSNSIVFISRLLFVTDTFHFYFQLLGMSLLILIKHKLLPFEILVDFVCGLCLMFHLLLKLSLAWYSGMFEFCTLDDRGIAIKNKCINWFSLLSPPIPKWSYEIGIKLLNNISVPFFRWFQLWWN